SRKTNSHIDTRLAGGAPSVNFRGTLVVKRGLPVWAGTPRCGIDDLEELFVRKLDDARGPRARTASTCEDHDPRVANAQFGQRREQRPVIGVLSEARHLHANEAFELLTEGFSQGARNFRGVGRSRSPSASPRSHVARSCGQRMLEFVAGIVKETGRQR